MNSIGLVGDGDDVDLLVDCETTFGVQIRDAQRLQTVGDLFETIMSNLGHGPTSICFSRRGFYTLRYALRRMGIESPITPDTPLLQLTAQAGISERSFFRRLRTRCGLHVPELVLGSGSARLLAFLSNRPGISAAALCSTGFALFSTVDLALALGISALLVFLVPVLGTVLRRGMPEYCTTVGDLARAVGAGFLRNQPNLMPAAHPNDLWCVLTDIIRSNSGYQGPVNRETTFFHTHRRQSGDRAPCGS